MKYTNHVAIEGVYHGLPEFFLWGIFAWQSGAFAQNAQNTPQVRLYVTGCSSLRCLVDELA
jgi:hypothetical protein